MVNEVLVGVLTEPDGHGYDTENYRAEFNIAVSNIKVGTLVLGANIQR